MENNNLHTPNSLALFFQTEILQIEKTFVIIKGQNVCHWAKKIE
jgi:hypothetical protein